MIMHCCMSIEGAIRNANTLKGAITVDGETLYTVKEIRDFMRGQLALGRRVLPMCKCSNFNYQKGCLGHEKPEAWLTLKRIGLNNPTEVEYKGKTIVTVGLDVETLVKTWRETFNLKDEVLFLETDKDTMTGLKKSTSNSKSVYDLFAVQEVYLREEEE